MTERSKDQDLSKVKGGSFVTTHTGVELRVPAVDGRTSVGKALGQFRNALIEDVGGRDNISTQQAAIIGLAVRTKLILDSIDSWLLAQPSLVDKRRRALLPVVRDRQKLADALARYLDQLGLERREHPYSFRPPRLPAPESPDDYLDLDE